MALVRRLPLILLLGTLVVIALSTGWEFLFFILYLLLLVVGGAYLLTRVGLSDLEAGYALDRLAGHVGEELRVTYTLRNTSRLPKPWLEAHNPTTLPAGLPGRVLGLGPRAERSWLIRAPLMRRGHFRIEPLNIRTGDPFGFFEAQAAVGQGVTVVVYPMIERLPLWRLPPAGIEGTHAHAERTLQATPLATTVRPWAPGDAYSRIHWRSTARHGDIVVKDFDLEQTADAWIFLDLQHAVQAGAGDDSTVEVAVRAAASIADKAILENRSVGLTTNGRHQAVLPADRGGRQQAKIMSLLAAVDGDGMTPLDESIVAGLPRIRRGMTVIVITPSTQRDWIRPLATLRSRGIGCAVVLVDAMACVRATATARARATGAELPPEDDAVAVRARAVHHALAEYELPVRILVPGEPLAGQLT
jgi:uncharacterized protein (DUF58 family)